MSARIRLCMREQPDAGYRKSLRSYFVRNPGCGGVRDDKIEHSIN